MRFNFKKDTEFAKAVLLLQKLKKEESIVDIIKKQKKRTISQNAYLHKVFQVFAIHIGQTSEEAKTDIKRAYGLYYEKNGKKYLRATAGLSVLEMQKFIDFILIWASKEHQCFIPSSQQYLDDQFNIDAEISKYEGYING